MNQILRSHLVFVILLGLTAAAPAQEAEPPEPLGIDLPAVEQLPLKALSTILDLIERGQADRAIQQANLMIERAAANDRLEHLANLYFQLAFAQQQNGEPFAAALSFLRVVVHYPDRPLALHAMERAGHALYAARLPEPAEKLWRRAAERTEDAAMKSRLQAAIDAVETAADR